jgi:hypothetical protein
MVIHSINVYINGRIGYTDCATEQDQESITTILF